MTPVDILGLVRRALGDVAHHEQWGGDGVGTDAYPQLLDRRAELLGLLAHDDAGTRAAAAHALAFLVEHAAEIQPALDAALAAARFDLERAALIVASARLRTSVAHAADPDRVGSPWDAVALAADVRTASRAIRAATAIAQVMGLSRRFGRFVHADLAAALDDADGLTAGPWGGGDLGALARDLRATVRVIPAPSTTPSPPASPDLVFDGAPHAADQRETVDLASGDTEDFDADVENPYIQEREVRPAPRIAIPGLHDVAWHELDDCYGKADGIPAMIEALTSDDPEERAWGLGSLDASIHHQGSVYPASGPAARFLLGLVERDDVEDRDRIVALLVGLAVHEHEWNLCSDLAAARSIAFDDVDAGGPVFVRLLGAPDPLLRAQAAQALSFVRPPAGAGDAVRAAIAGERDRHVRAGLLLCLGYLGRRARETGRDFDGAAARTELARWLASDCTLLAGCAAIGLAQLDGRDPDVRATLARVAATAIPITGPWPWNGGDLGAFAHRVWLASSTAGEAIDAAERAIAAPSRHGTETILLSGRLASVAASRTRLALALESATRAFALLFADDRHDIDRVWLPDELDEPRRRTLRALVAIATRPGDAQGALPDQLRAAGILPDAGAVRRLLGDAGGPCETRVTVAGAERPAWWAIHATLTGQLAPGEAVRAIAALSPAQRLAIVDDALDGPHRLPHERRHIRESEDYNRANDHTSRFLVLAAEIVESAGVPGLGWARAIAFGDAHRTSNRGGMRDTIAAIVLAREAIAHGRVPPDELDALVPIDGAPSYTYRLALREVFATFSPARCARIFATVPLYGYTSYRDPRGEVRRWRNGKGWDLLDLAPPAYVVAQLTAALREWKRHRAAGADREATPVVGVVTSALDRKPSPDEDFPRDRAIAMATAAGDLGSDLLRELTGVR